MFRINETFQMAILVKVQKRQEIMIRTLVADCRVQLNDISLLEPF